MSLATLSGTAVVAATICLPRVGAWRADVELDAAAAFTGPQTLKAGPLTLQGSVVRSGAFAGTAYARLVGGAGGLGRDVTPRSYRGPTAGIVLADILSDLGEASSAGTDPALLARQLPAWVRVQQSGGAALTALADALGVSWRVQPDGSVWLGVEAWPAASPGRYDVLHEWPEDARAELGIESPAILPGTVLAGRRVDYVEHVLASDRLLSRVWYTS